MAKPIEPTPTLKGKDAERFYESIEEAQYDPSKDKQLEEARGVYKAVRKKWHKRPSSFK